MEDLKTMEGRLTALYKIEDSFINSLRDLGIQLSENSVCTISLSCIDLGIKTESDISGKKMDFGSSIEIYAGDSVAFSGNKENKISVSSSSSFSPKDQASYWRIVHAGFILTNWDKICPIVNSHCEMYRDLMCRIFQKINFNYEYKGH